MFKDLEVMAVLPAQDISRARTFYRDKLGLEPSDDMGAEGLLYTCGKGTAFFVYETDNAGSARNTQIAWRTDDVEREVNDLRARGVTIEDYDLPGLKTENGIATNENEKSAWFKDSEGNFHAVSQRV